MNLAVHYYEYLWHKKHAQTSKKRISWKSEGCRDGTGKQSTQTRQVSPQQARGTTIPHNHPYISSCKGLAEEEEEEEEKKIKKRYFYLLAGLLPSTR